LSKDKFDQLMEDEQIEFELIEEDEE